MPDSRSVALVLLLATAACGRLAHFEERRVEDAVDLPTATRSIRIALPEGPITVHPGRPGVVQFELVVRCAADSREDVARLTAIDPRPVVAMSSDVEGLAVLTFPGVPDGLDPAGHSLVIKALMWAPPDLPLEARTGLGAVSAVKRAAATTLQTERGDVRLAGCVGSATVRLDEGNTLVDRHRGALDVHAATRGGMQIYVAELAPGGVRLITGDGSIMCRIPLGSHFELEASTERGKLKNSFGIETDRSGYAASMRGRTPGGEPPLPRIELRTRQGHISLSGKDFGQR